MKKVLQCDFCFRTGNDLEDMKTHEKKCVFNPKNKKCFSCTYIRDHGYTYPIPTCGIDLDYIKGEEEGNCDGWHAETEDDFKPELIPGVREIIMEGSKNLKNRTHTPPK